MRKDILILGGACTLSFAAGATTSFFVLRSRLSNHYADISAEQVREARNLYRDLHLKEFATPGDAVEALIPKQPEKPVDEGLKQDLRSYRTIVRTSGYGVPNEPPMEDILEEENDTVPVHPLLDKTARNPAEPFILTEDEFFDNDPEHEQLKYKFWLRDGAVSDGKDDPVDDWAEVIGLDLVNHFQLATELSGDPDKIYIRNNRLKTDFLIVQIDGSYRETVMGLSESDYRGEDG